MKLELPDLKIEERKVRVLLATKLFEDRVVSLGKAAEVSGYSEQTFAELLQKNGISPIRYQDLDLNEERQNA